MTSAHDAYVAGLRLLARRELSVAQLRERLARRDWSVSDIDEALERLQQEGALDDRRMARAFASTAARVKGRGRLRILRELDATGVDRETARAAVDDVFSELDAHRCRHLLDLVDGLGQGIITTTDESVFQGLVHWNNGNRKFFVETGRVLAQHVS